MAKNIYQKIWDAHLVAEPEGQEAILYIDRHYVHEVTSPQAFEGLRLVGRKVRRPELTYATMDHNIPTTDRALPIADALSRAQVETLKKNCDEFGVACFDMQDPRNGIVHVVGPELGLTLPGMTIVCGDSHTSTHGAFGALAHGIGTSEVEHVLATQTLLQKRSKTMEVRVNGALAPGLRLRCGHRAHRGPGVARGGCRHRLADARHGLQTGTLGGCLGLDFVAEHVEAFRAGADEDDPAFGAALATAGDV